MPVSVKQAESTYRKYAARVIQNVSMLISSVYRNAKLNANADTSSVICEPDKTHYQGSHKGSKSKDQHTSHNGDQSFDLLGAGSQFE